MAVEDMVGRHCAELNRCNQRGGRMLSVFDLIEAGTLDVELAAYLMSWVGRGASFMIGALPGGAGKTTVMCALLNLVPTDVELVAATAESVREVGSGSGRKCHVCHEISSGPYFAYLWGQELRDYCALGERGHILATNLHADDLHEARDQVCGQNGVPMAQFEGFSLLVFLRMKNGWREVRRVVDKVYHSDGTSPHRLVFDEREGLHGVEDDGWASECGCFLRETMEAGVRTIEDTRGRVLSFLGR